MRPRTITDELVDTWRAEELLVCSINHDRSRQGHYLFRAMETMANADVRDALHGGGQLIYARQLQFRRAVRREHRLHNA